jgi:putative nucleotidyltransferase with HDIG domain
MTTLEQLVLNTNFSHSRNVARISRIIALKHGYSQAEADAIEQAALYHDVGKSTIPPEILRKPGPLTPDEYAVMKSHAEAGYSLIMEAVELLIVAAAVAKEHHERLDGSGYLRMPGRELSPYARIISIADVFDALISRRSYKEPWDIDDVIKYLTDHAEHFDEDIVRCLVSEINSVLLLYGQRTA